MALTKAGAGEYDDTRVFFVTDSPEDNEELFDTIEDAEEYIHATKFRGKPRVRICVVKHAYIDDNGEWNYDDEMDTFKTIKDVTEWLT